MKNSGTESCPSLTFCWNLSNIRCSLVGWLCFHPIWWGAGGFLRISHVHKIGCCRGRATAESLQNRTKEATQKSSACGLPSLPPVLLAWLSLRRTQLLLSLSHCCLLSASWLELRTPRLARVVSATCSAAKIHHEFSVFFIHHQSRPRLRGSTVNYHPIQTIGNQLKDVLGQEKSTQTGTNIFKLMILWILRPFSILFFFRLFFQYFVPFQNGT